MNKVSQLSEISARIRQLQIADDPDHIFNVIHGFVADAFDSFDEMREACRKRNLMRLKNSLSHIQTSCDSLGANHLLPICREIAELLDGGELFKVQPVIDRFGRELENLRQELGEFEFKRAA